MVHQFYPDTANLKPGQTVWSTIAKSEKGSYGKRIEDSKIVPVVIELIPPNAAAERASGKRLRIIKKETVARICKSVDAQGGCITNAELAILTMMSTGTVGKMIREWETEFKEVLPRRGTIHDMGPTMTHKSIIIEKLFVQHKTVQQTSRETYHSLEAIQRYISAFRQVLLCWKKGMTVAETAFAVKHTERLVKEYLKIIESYKDRGHILDRIARGDGAHVENNIETFIETYGVNI
jgi:hypothetical protein